MSVSIIIIHLEGIRAGEEGGQGCCGETYEGRSDNVKALLVMLIHSLDLGIETGVSEAGGVGEEVREGDWFGVVY